MSRFVEIEDISFLGDVTLAELKETAQEVYRAKFEEITGSRIAGIPDEDRAILYAAAQLVFMAAEAVDNKAKQNLLKYSTGAYLDNLALCRGLVRKKSEAAYVTVRFTLSAVRPRDIVIPKGTRVTSAARQVMFETTASCTVAAGELYTDVVCAASEAGAAGNDFAAGELNVLIDPIAYVAKVENINEPSGGADEETDDELAERVFLARVSYSTAGSEQAYIYHTKSFSTLIDDVVVTNPDEALIYIYILTKDRKEMDGDFLHELWEYLNRSEIKPLTDTITVLNAERVDYSLDVSYKIYEKDLPRYKEIQTAVSAAADEYIEWQGAVIGRDIKPQKLISLMIQAGASSVVVNSPENTHINGAADVKVNDPANREAAQIARCVSVNVEYDGYEEE